MSGIVIYDGRGSEVYREEHAPIPAVLNDSDWRAYAYKVLGNIASNGTAEEKFMAGIRRYGKILKDARASSDEGVIAAIDQYDVFENFHKDKVHLFLGMLATASVVSVTECDAIDDEWPVV